MLIVYNILLVMSRIKFMITKIRKQLNQSAAIKQIVAETMAEEIADAATRIIESFANDGKLILFGNGGSAADAQHIAAEFVGRFKIKRLALPAIALGMNASTTTAIGNDFGIENIFARSVGAFVRTGDVVIAISTSGNATNVIRAVGTARAMGAQTIALTGGDGGSLAVLVDLALIVPSDDTPRIQEAHITIGHIICDLVEQEVERVRHQNFCNLVEG